MRLYESWKTDSDNAMLCAPPTILDDDTKRRLAKELGDAVRLDRWTWVCLFVRRQKQ